MKEKPMLAKEAASWLCVEPDTVTRNHDRYGGYRVEGERKWKFPRQLIMEMSQGRVEKAPPLRV